MIFCDRCGIEVKVKGLCNDCVGMVPYARKRGPMSVARRQTVYPKILEFAALDISRQEIADELGVHVATVNRVVRMAGVMA